MSWDGYIDNLVGQSKDAAGTNHCDKACIIGKDGSKWTGDTHGQACKITAAEAATIGRCFKNNDFTPLMASGVRIEGEKYQFLREEDNKLVLAKKKDMGSITIQASKTALIIGHTAEGCQQGNTNKAVAVIADYLENQGM